MTRLSARHRYRVVHAVGTGAHARVPLLVALAALLLFSPLAWAQFLGPIGPGEASYEDDHVRGRLVDWHREATPSLVLNAPGNRVLRVFADIAADGSFTLALPEITADTPLGSRTCGDPARDRITVLSDVDLLTPLDGFTAPTELNNNLSVIGMAMLADEAFANDIAAPGTRRVQWFASRSARTIEVGECNNDNAFDIGVGWTPVTVVSGPSGGPHSYHRGIEEGLAWYWWAFAESPAEAEAPPTVERERPMWMVGAWQASQVDTSLVLQLGADGAGRIEVVEGGNVQVFEGDWSIGGGLFVLEMAEGPLQLFFEQLSETSFRLFDEGEDDGFVVTPLE